MSSSILWLHVIWLRFSAMSIKLDLNIIQEDGGGVKAFLIMSYFGEGPEPVGKYMTGKN